MENFFYGLQSSGETLRLTTLAVIRHPMIWGFGVGFLVSTCMHLFIATDIPHTIPTMVRNTAAESFRKITGKDEAGVYIQSYTAFQKEHNRVRIAFYVAVTVFLLVAALALARG